MLETPSLGELHRKFQAAGLEVVGFNTTDTREVALRYLAGHKAGFPSVLDSSPAARQVQNGQYQTIPGKSAVPLNYIIGRDGRVVDSWYGFDAERTSRVLAGLGIK